MDAGYPDYLVRIARRFTFWTESRMRLYKRMGFSAIYMPTQTLADVQNQLRKNGTESAALNVNGTALYRAIVDFPVDMLRVAGRSVLAL